MKDAKRFLLKLPPMGWMVWSENILLLAAIWSVFKGEHIEALLIFIIVEIRYLTWVIKAKENNDNSRGL